MMALQSGHIASWFTHSQVQSVLRNGVFPEWFHGIITRKKAEELLMTKPRGYFLIRVSESRIGYTLSHRVDDRCRHFMIDSLEDGSYVVVGDSRHHQTLQDLVDFHRRNPVLPYSEVLTAACGQSLNNKTHYAELQFPQRQSKDNPTPPNWGDNKSQHETIPPTLPHRTPTAVPYVALCPSSEPNRLYPRLGDQLPSLKYTANDSAVDQAPVIPAQICIPSSKENQGCTRTISVSEFPPAPSATQHTPGSGSSSVSQPATSHEVKPRVVSNLRNLKIKFHKKSGSQEHEGSADANGETRGEKTLGGATFCSSQHEVTVTDGALPYEYLPPPPFAPGYCHTSALLEKQSTD